MNSPHRLLVAAAVLLLGPGLLAGAPAPAGAPAAQVTVAPGVRDGVCTTADHDFVTLVVDFQALGGSTVVKCLTGVPDGSSGGDVLGWAGIAVAEPTASPGFACRLAGRPGPAESLAVSGDPGYIENCTSTPPSTAYWSYWSAKAGGAWGYNSRGMWNNRVKLNGFEGWSFSLNAASGGSPAPRVAPVAQPAPEPPKTTTTTAPKPTTTKPTTLKPPAEKPTTKPTTQPAKPATTAPTTTEPATTQPATTESATTAPRTTAPGTAGQPTQPGTTQSGTTEQPDTERPSTTSPTATASTSPSASATSSAEVPSSASATSPSVPPSHSSSASTSVVGESAASATDLEASNAASSVPADDATGSSSGPWVTLTVIAVLALAGGGAVWWSRTRSRASS